MPAHGLNICEFGVDSMTTGGTPLRRSYACIGGGSSSAGGVGIGDGGSSTGDVSLGSGRLGGLPGGLGFSGCCPVRRLSVRSTGIVIRGCTRLAVQDMTRIADARPNLVFFEGL
jgi:hypothetical protein